MGANGYLKCWLWWSPGTTRWPRSQLRSDLDLTSVPHARRTDTHAGRRQGLEAPGDRMEAATMTTIAPADDDVQIVGIEDESEHSALMTVRDANGATETVRIPRRALREPAST